MLTYALRLATSRPALWWPAAAMAALLALPGSVVALAAPGAALALGLTGDAALAAALLPAWAHPALLVTAGTLAFAAYTRLQAVALWLSDEDNEASVQAAWRATARLWRASALLVLAVNAALLGALALLLAATKGAPQALGGWVLLLGGAGLLVARVLVRIRLTLAQRALLLAQHPARACWGEAGALMAAGRHTVAATWVALASAGVALWLGGRLITPVLQDTALSFPAASTAALVREAGQLAFAVPLESALIVLALGAWTAVLRGIDESPGQVRAGARPGWMAGALAALLVLAIVGNLLPIAAERSFEQRRRTLAAAISARALEPADALGETRRGPATAAGAPVYLVEADLRGQELAWTTTITYTNRSQEKLSDLGINIYAAAYERDLEDIPLARDLIAADARGRLAAELRPGDLTVGQIEVDGRRAAHELRDSALTVELPRPLAQGATTTVVVPLSMRLPVFPERFGTFDEVTLLGNFVPVAAQRAPGRWRLDPYGAVGDPFFSEAADHRVTLEVDEDLGVVGSGQLVALEPGAEPGRVRWTFELAGGRDPAFAVSRLLRGLQTRRAGLTLRAWYAGGDGLAAWTALKDAAAAAARYTAWFGPLPFEEVELFVRPGALGGMEYPGFVTVTDGAPANAGLLADLLRYAGFARAAERYVVAHEMAHQWWYAAVGSDQVEQPFLDEALAEVSARLHLRAQDGDERAWMMVNLRRSAEPVPKVVSLGVDAFASNDDYTETIYLGGSQALLEVRAAAGHRAFLSSLRGYYADNAGGLATLDDLEAAFRRVSPAAAQAFARYR